MPPPTRAQLIDVVQRMQDAGESEENIAAVLQHYQTVDAAPVPPSVAAPPQPTPKDTYTGPTDFWGGFKEAFRPGGEVEQASRAGLKGYVKGALDLPGTIMGGLRQVGNLITDPVGTVQSIPQGLSDMASNIAQTTKMAGSDPEAFGRMMGEVTGQPLTTAGLVRYRAPITKGVGKLTTGAGKIMEQHQPLSSWIPRIAEPRIARSVQRGMGRGLQTVGKAIERKGNRMGVTRVQGEIVPPEMPPEFKDVTPRLTAPPIYTEPPAPTGGYFDIPMDMQSPTAGAHMNTPPVPHNIPPTPVPPPAPAPTNLLAESNPIQLPSKNVAPFDVQSPTAGAHMNSPVTPHGIPPAPAAPTANTMTVPKKSLNPAVIKHLKDRGFELSGIDEKGNLLFSSKTGGTITP